MHQPTREDLAGVLPDAIVVVAPDATIRWCNAAAERMFGIPLEDASGRPALELLHPDDLQFALNALETVQEKVAGNPIEIRVKAADGWRLVELVGAPMPNGDIALDIRDLTERRYFEIAHGEEARFRSLVHNAAAITMLLDADGIIQSASASITRLVGHDQEAITGRPLADLLVDEDARAVLRDAMADAAPGAMTTALVELPLVGRGGTVPVEFSIANLLEDPTVGGYVLSGHDVTGLVAAEHEARRALSLLTATLDSTADGILVVDRDGHITSANRRFAQMWRIPDALLAAGDDHAALAFVLDQLVHPEDFIRKVEELYGEPEAESYDMLEFLDGRVFERFSLPQWVDGEVVGRVWSFRDLTERKQLEDALVYRAFHDSLTGLANKARFCDRLQHASARSSRAEHDFAVLFLDVDNFKTVNDSLGHQAGDRLLVEAGRRLQECLRAADTPARLGGDEFAVLIEDVSDPSMVDVIAGRIRDAFQSPIALDGREVVSTVSIGIAFGGTGATSEELLRDADLAMYSAKAKGKNRFERYASEQHEEAVARVDLTADLHHAIERDEFEVAYQPIVETRGEAIVAVEALVRWRHPQRGVLGPADFVPIAEDAGLMDVIGRRVLEQAAEHVASWNRSLTTPISLSVNASPRQLVGDTIVEDVAAVLAATGLPPANLVIEITETAMMQDENVATTNLHALDALGVRLALDDFGTGFSSLTYLDQFPIDIVKIDKSFVAIMGRPDARPLAPAIVHLAHSLHLVTVAEGVETREQLVKLRLLGCDLLQGFLFHRPMPAEELGALLGLGTETAAS